MSQVYEQQDIYGFIILSSSKVERGDFGVCLIRANALSFRKSEGSPIPDLGLDFFNHGFYLCGKLSDTHTRSLCIA